MKNPLFSHSLLALLLAFLLSSPNSFAQTNPRLECTFGNGGVLLVGAPWTCFTPKDVAVYQSGPHQGKMVVGITICDNGSNTDFGAVRLNANGSVDQTFGTDGFVGPISIRVNDNVHRVLIQSDDKIMLMGNTDNPGCAGGGSSGIALVRLNVDGSLDNTFSGDGKLHEFFVLNPGGCNTNITSFNDAILQADDRLVACGTIGGVPSNNSDITAGLVRYETDGSRLSGSTRRVNFRPRFNGTSGPSETFSGLTLQGNKIVVAGTIRSGEFIVTARFNSDFTPDMTFGTNGREEFQPNGATNTYSVEDVRVHEGDAFVIGYEASTITDYLVMRRDKDGGIDNSFGTSGIATLDDSGTSESMRGIEVAYSPNNNRILVFGNPSIGDFGAMRTLNGGSPDNGFGTGGQTYVDIPPGLGSVTQATLQPDGKLLLVGGSNVIILMRMETTSGTSGCSPVFGPSASCSDLTVTLSPGPLTATITPEDVESNSFSEVGIKSIAATPLTFNCSNSGPNNVTVTVTDNNDLTDDCTAIVLVRDNTPPNLNCPGNITQDNDTDLCGAVVNYTVNASDACSPTASVTQTDNSGLTSGDAFPVGVTTQTWEGADLGGNTATCSFTITINDTTPPTITCPANIVKANDTDVCQAVVTFPDATFMDNCPNLPVAQTGGLISGSAFPGNTTSSVTFKVQDTGGNIATCTFTITVNDTTKPGITCPANITQTNDAGVCGAAISYSISSDDNCPGVTHAQTDASGIASGGVYPVGTTDQTYTATDVAGNTMSCSFTITITDDEDPMPNCPGTLVRNTDPTVCTHTAAGGDLDLMPTDNCAIASQVNDLTGTGSLDGYVFSKGKSFVTWTVTDIHGNTNTCTHCVRIRDREAPVFDNCPPGTTIVVPAFTPGAYHSWPVPLTATDNCNPLNKLTITGFPLTGSYFPIGTTTVTWTATDKANNVGTCAFDVTVEEEDPPVPPGWTPENIGTGVTSSTTFDNATGTLTIQIAGGTIGNSGDNVGGACLTSSDATIDFRARVNPPGIGYYEQAGLMMRQSTAPNAAQFSMLLTGTSVPVMMFRPSAGSFPLSTNGTSVSKPYWLRLHKFGSTVTGYVSPNGVNWTMIMSYPNTLFGTIELCLVSVTSGAQGTATFDNISINGVAPRFGASAPSTSSGAGVILTGMAVSAFPNPFEDYLLVEGRLPVGSQEVNFELYNQLGQVVARYTTDADEVGVFEKRLALHGLSAGMYMLAVRGGAERRLIKVVKR